MSFQWRTVRSEETPIPLGNIKLFHELDRLRLASEYDQSTNGKMESKNDILDFLGRVAIHDQHVLKHGGR